MMNSLSSLGALHWSTVASALCLASLLYLASLALYRLYLHPLAGYPGPWLGKLTEWNTILASLRGESTRARHAWGMRYGPGPVRIGPDELLFSDAGSVRDIYGQTSTPCTKDPAFYGAFTVCGARNVFNAYDRAEHARIRRLFSHAFSSAEIRRTQRRVVPIIEKCLGQIAAESSSSAGGGGQKSKAVNVYEPFLHLFLDVVSELSFDRSFDTLGGHLLAEARWADQLQDISALVGMVPFIEWVPARFVQEAVRARPLMIDFARRRIRDFRDRLARGEVRDGSLLKRVVETKVEGGEQPLSDLELMENAIVFMQAGSETSMSTLLYLLYEVDRHPEVKRRLVEEIRAACPADVSKVPDFDSIEHLPYLNQVLDETLRLRGPIPVNLPRISPGKVIGGHYVPAGTRVCNLAYTTHRDPAAFGPDPEAFRPERWASTRPPAELEAMRLRFRPFSTGPRSCIGMHLARMDIMLTVCLLYQRYDVRLDPATTEELMYAQDRGVMSPQGKKVLFHVTPRK